MAGRYILTLKEISILFARNESYILTPNEEKNLFIESFCMF